MDREKAKYLLNLLIIIVLFTLSSFLVQTNLDFIKGIINKTWGMPIFVLLSIIEVVVAPISLLPLLPVASNLWGWFLTAILSIIGWTIGGTIAFLIARKYGVDFIKKFFSIKKIEELEKLIPSEHVFLGIILLRMAIPVDLLSYVLGLFSNIKTRDYILATFIGVIPFAFIFAYAGTLPFYYQLIILSIAFLVLLVGFYVKKKRDEKKNRK
jgi:uncharacterized membrane protein YdjX (TVP38/TMEM64 family)